MPGENPFLNYLEDRPEAAYFGQQGQWKSPNMKKYFQSQFGNIQNQYLGNLANWVTAGSTGAPQKFTDFIGQYNWGQNYQEQGGGQRDTGRFSPFTRWQV